MHLIKDIKLTFLNIIRTFICDKYTTLNLCIILYRLSSNSPDKIKPVFIYMQTFLRYKINSYKKEFLYDR